MVIIREHVHYDEAVSTRKARLGAVRFRLGPLLPLAYFASPSVRETINRALHTVGGYGNPQPIQFGEIMDVRTSLGSTRILDLARNKTYVKQENRNYKLITFSFIPLRVTNFAGIV